MTKAADGIADSPAGERFGDLFQDARDAMRQFDDALESLGSPRKPEKRLDRAPAAVPSIPIFDPAKLGY